MKIISYNIANYSQSKIDALLKRGADVYILPEVHSCKEVSLPPEFELFRFADAAESNKGLGVIARKECCLCVPSWFDEAHKYILPLLCDDIIILAMWPTCTQSNSPKGYPQIALEALRYYSTYFVGKKVLITGDFNCFMGQRDASERRGTLKQIVEYLSSHKIFSLYHLQTGEEFGNESRATFHWRYRVDERFFLDYTFTNIYGVRYTLEEWDATFSDHHAQEIII